MKEELILASVSGSSSFSYLKTSVLCGLLSKCRRRDTGVFFELTNIMFRGIVSNCFGNISDRQGCICQKVL